MSLFTHDILAQVAIRISALVGPTAGPLNTTYATRPLTSANFKSAVFPFEACIDAILNAEGQLANAIAFTANHPWRSYLAGVTSPLAHMDRLPSLSSISQPIIGVWGAVRNSADGRILTEQPIEVIQRRVDNPGSFFTQPAYYFRMDGDRILHTRALVVIDCCVFDALPRRATIANNGFLSLPDSLEQAYVAGALSNLVRDNQFVEQAAGFKGYFDDTLAMIMRGGTNVQPFSGPAGSVNPVEG